MYGAYELLGEVGGLHTSRGGRGPTYFSGMYGAYELLGEVGGGGYIFLGEVGGLIGEVGGFLVDVGALSWR